MAYDPDAWFVDCDGRLHYLRQYAPAHVEICQMSGYVEVRLLASPDGDLGREVLDAYVLHTGPVPDWIRPMPCEHRDDRQIGIELRDVYDGVSFWNCLDCGKVRIRWEPGTPLYQRAEPYLQAVYDMYAASHEGKAGDA